MTLQERIDGAKPYLKLFNISLEDDAISAVLELPEGWVFPDDKVVADTYGVIRRVNGSQQYLFTEVSNGYERLFDCIEYVISSNIEVERIKELFSQKVLELKELFTQKTYDELQGLEFVLKPVKKPAVGKKVVKPKVEKPAVVEEPKPTPAPPPAPKQPKKQNPPVSKQEDDLLAFAEGLTNK